MHKLIDGKRVEVDAVDVATDALEKKMTLKEAILSLSHEDVAHWTKGGLPDLNVLIELTGGKVSRKEVAAAIPDYTRQTKEA